MKTQRVFRSQVSASLVASTITVRDGRSIYFETAIGVGVGETLSFSDGFRCTSKLEAAAIHDSVCDWAKLPAKSHDPNNARHTGCKSRFEDALQTARERGNV